MNKVLILGAVLVSLPIQAGLALEPAEAGRQARDELDALIEKQREDREAASAPSADQPDRTASPAKAKRPAPSSIESKVPTICVGCGAK